MNKIVALPDDNPILSDYLKTMGLSKVADDLNEDISMEYIKNISDQLDDLIRNHGKEAFQATLKRFFDEVPEVQSVVWAQYTPSFNDGDPCEFSIGEPEFKRENEEDPDYTWGEECYCNSLDEKNHEKTLTKEEKSAHKKMYHIVSLLDEKILEVLFGNDQLVTVTREGVKTAFFDCGY